MKEGLVGGEGFAIDASVVRADANRARGVPGSEAAQWKSDENSSRAVREYIDGLENINPPEVPPKSVSLTDPAARYTAAPGGPAFFAYATNYLVDVSAGIIVDVEATPAFRTDEVNATRTMIERVEERFEMKPTRLIGDMAYGAAELLGWMVNDKAIEPHVPVWDKTQRSSSNPLQSLKKSGTWHIRIGAPGRSTSSCVRTARPGSRLDVRAHGATLEIRNARMNWAQQIASAIAGTGSIPTVTRDRGGSNSPAWWSGQSAAKRSLPC